MALAGPWTIDTGNNYGSSRRWPGPGSAGTSRRPGHRPPGCCRGSGGTAGAVCLDRPLRGGGHPQPLHPDRPVGRDAPGHVRRQEYRGLQRGAVRRRFPDGPDGGLRKHCSAALLPPPGHSGAAARPPGDGAGVPGPRRRPGEGGAAVQHARPADLLDDRRDVESRPVGTSAGAVDDCDRPEPLESARGPGAPVDAVDPARGLRSRSPLPPRRPERPTT